MDEQKRRSDGRIRAKCPLYACRVCRTKTNWKHQSWCELSEVLKPSCRDCCYWEEKQGRCGHPAHRKVGERA